MGKRAKTYDPTKFTAAQIEFARWVDADNASEPPSVLAKMARAMVDPDNRRRAMRSLGIETPAQKRESDARARAFRAWAGSVAAGEITMHCQFPTAPKR